MTSLRRKWKEKEPIGRCYAPSEREVGTSCPPERGYVSACMRVSPSSLERARGFSFSGLLLPSPQSDP